jgi:hypothetical protein
MTAKISPSSSRGARRTGCRNGQAAATRPNRNCRDGSVDEKGPGPLAPWETQVLLRGPQNCDTERCSNDHDRDNCEETTPQ